MMGEPIVSQGTKLTCDPDKTVSDDIDKYVFFTNKTQQTKENQKQKDKEHEKKKSSFIYVKQFLSFFLY